MVGVGGIGSLYGAIIGTALFVVVERYLQLVIGRALSGRGQREPAVSAGFAHPDRWLLWRGLAFVLAAYFAPLGVVGALKAD